MRTRITTLFRRWLLLWALLFWQGGFMFYGGVVIPVGASILGSDLEQGFITRSVTNYLNIAGAVALAVWGWELAATRGSALGGPRLRWAVWGGLVLMLAALAWLHRRLDAQLVPEDTIVLNRHRFLDWHAAYVTVSSFQWGGCLLLSALTLWAWRDEDRKATDRP